MTQEAFIEYLLSYDCDITEDGNNYRCIIRSDRTLRTMMPKKNKNHSLRAITMCEICQSLKLTPPPEIEFADGILKQIKEHVRKNQ